MFCKTLEVFLGYLLFIAILLTVAVMVYRQTVFLRRAIADSDENVAAVFESEVPDFVEVCKVMQTPSMDQMAADDDEKFAIAYVIQMGMKAVARGAARTRRPSVMKAVANSTFMIITNASSRFNTVYGGYTLFVKEYGSRAGVSQVPAEHFRLLLERVASVKSIRRR